MSRTVLASLILGPWLAPGLAHAQEVINPRTGASYTTLASAIASAIDDDTLEISGVLVESVVIDKSLTLLGEPGAAIQSGAANILTLNPSIDLTIDGLLLDGTANTRGILATAGDNQIVVMNSVFSTGSTAGINGGGISATNPRLILVQDTVFQGVTGVVNATQGGAIYVTAAATAPVVIEDTVFDRIRASGSGGALYGGNVDLVCTGCTFDHTVGGQGGAVFMTNAGALTVERSLFCAVASSLGAVFSSAPTAEIRSSLFVEGTAAQGSALYLNNGAWTIDNNHFLGHGSPSTIRKPSTGVVTTLRNNLLLNNLGTAVNRSGVNPSTEYNWFQGNATDTNYPLSGTNLINPGSPQLVAWSQDGNCGNDELWPSPVVSPLFDIGDPAVTDPDGTRSDIGAFGGAAADPYYHTDNDGDGLSFLDDCDDTDASVFGGAPEVCDGIDNDCDGSIDEDVTDQDAFHEDCDGDGQGNPVATFVQCLPPAEPPACGGVWLSEQNDGPLASLDCDDTDPDTRVGAPETCDPGDNNCDGNGDVGAIDAFDYFQDDDFDGFGSLPERSCIAPPPPGLSLVAGDCSDSDPTFFPSAPDSCGDGLDQDCSGGDGTAAQAQTWYPDTDGDGYGDPAATPEIDCRDLTHLGYVLDATDCNDTNAAVNPGADEVCDGIDNDCSGAVDDLGTPVDWTLDADGDGFGDDAATVSADCAPTGYVATGGDCDDADPLVHPGAPEVCDGVDNDCSGVVDDVTAPVDWFLDADADGYGDDGIVVTAACTPGTGWVDVGGDCDDADALVNPAGLELCDGVDNDCDGSVDNTGAAVVWVQDVDGDGFGDDSTATTSACAPGSDWTQTGGDCDDTDATVFPAAAELCDGQVNACGGALPADESDADADGYAACTVDAGGWDGDPAVVGGDDCDDADDTVYPGATEICDLVDEDCNGVVDDLGAPISWSRDIDSDGFGDDATTIVADCPPDDSWVPAGGDCDDLDDTVYPGAEELCDGQINDCGQPLPADEADADLDHYAACAVDIGGWDGDPFVIGGDDCDDTDPTVNPGAVEVCDGIDQDCDGTVDDTGAPIAWYDDADGDGFGDDTTATQSECAPGPTWTALGADCDDLDPTVNPGAAEVCDGADNDCDGTVDNTGSPSTWYVDADADGYGDPGSAFPSDCPPAGGVAVAGDCNDQDAGVHPGAAEVCDGVDQDCDGTVDDTGVPQTFYVDVDSDGFGDDTTAFQAECAPADTVSTVGGDCDDTDDTVFPGAPELCDGQVNACGGALPADESDADGDHYVVCTVDAGGWDGDPSVLGGDDCDDAQPLVNPGAAELCDGLDNDCDGAVDNTGAPVPWYADFDGDGFGADATVTVAECSPGPGFVLAGGDCDDAAATTFPGAPEVCDGVDQDCDGTVDDTGAPTDWYFDGDGDGYGDDATALPSDCDPGDGSVPVGGDCDDDDAAIHPAAAEVCDGVDQDCDGVVDNTGSPSTWYADADADGFGNDATATVADCVPGAGWSPVGGDCDDADAAVFPGATEVCNGLDDDCDGTVDDTGPVVTWYLDADGDGYGNSATATVSSCPPGTAYVQVGGDCNDAHPGVNPGATELDDDLDNDCDGEIDEGFGGTCSQSWPWWTWQYWYCLLCGMFGIC